MKLLERVTERVLWSPLLWGGAMAFAFHSLLEFSSFNLPGWALDRLTGKWESYVCSSLFFVAVAFLAIRCISLISQVRAWQLCATQQTTDDAEPASFEILLEPLEANSWLKDSVLARRLRDVCDFSQREGTAAALDARMKQLSDADYDRLYTDYGWMRTLIWVIPSCGSVATLLAIAGVVENFPTEPDGNVLGPAVAGLSAAFNVFAFAVGLGVVLVVIKFAVEQAEQQMLAAIDKLMNATAATHVGESAVNPKLPGNELLQLTDVLKTVATSLSQATQNGSGVLGASMYSGKQPQDMEAVIQAAIAAAVAKQPAAGRGGDIIPFDGGNMQGLQPILQKLVQVLERQNARIESEAGVTTQLNNIIDEGLQEPHEAPRVRERVRPAAA